MIRLIKLGSVLGIICGIAVRDGQAAGFKVTNVHFETNASACDMGAQIGFDTEGLVEGTVEDPTGGKVYSFHASGGMRETGGQTEGFLENVEPQITELVTALNCTPSSEEGVSSLSDLFTAWPAGDYTFTGQGKGTVTLLGRDRLTHHIPAGPKVLSPPKGAVLPIGAVLIRWNPVTKPILPALGPVTIVGYHVIVEEAKAGVEVTPGLDVDLSATESSLRVPSQYLKGSTAYKFEVLSTEESGNQTITEGYFCTTGVTTCPAPQ